MSAASWAFNIYFFSICSYICRKFPLFKILPSHSPSSASITVFAYTACSLQCFAPALNPTDHALSLRYFPSVGYSRCLLSSINFWRSIKSPCLSGSATRGHHSGLGIPYGAPTVLCPLTTVQCIGDSAWNKSHKPHFSGISMPFTTTLIFITSLSKDAQAEFRSNPNLR